LNDVGMNDCLCEVWGERDVINEMNGKGNRKKKSFMLLSWSEGGLISFSNVWAGMCGLGTENWIFFNWENRMINNKS
jgi:hypothetical protein